MKIKKPLHYTRFIELDTHKCVGCFKCVEACPKKVIGKISFLWHKHVLILHADKCIGCNKCADICKTKAISKR